MPRHQLTVGARFWVSVTIAVSAVVLGRASPGIGLMTTALADASVSPQDSPLPHEGFVTVNRIRLHYVDWGGRGPTLLLLAGAPGADRGFDGFAPRFTDQFHVMGLTRRGQGLSDKPASGYDVDTLASDIKGFLDALQIEQVDLAGYSVAGAEMTRFAVLHPERLIKMVYLDAAGDWAVTQELMKEANLTLPPGPVAAVEAGAAAYHPEFAKITVPTLAFFTVDQPQPAADDAPPALTQYLRLVVERHVVERRIEQFRAEAKNASVILLPGASHRTFLADPRYAGDVARQMRDFLLP